MEGRRNVPQHDTCHNEKHTSNVSPVGCKLDVFFSKSQTTSSMSTLTSPIQPGTEILVRATRKKMKQNTHEQ